MNTGGDAAEQIVKMSLQGAECAIKISGTGAKHIAILLYTILKNKKQSKGKARLETMLQTKKELKIFAVQRKDLRKFTAEAKKYGVLYCVLADKKNKDPNAQVDVIVKGEDAPRINRIVEKFRLASVDAGSLVAEVERDRRERQSDIENTMTGTSPESSPRENINPESSPRENMQPESSTRDNMQSEGSPRENARSERIESGTHISKDKSETEVEQFLDELLGKPQARDELESPMNIRTSPSKTSSGMPIGIEGDSKTQRPSVKKELERIRAEKRSKDKRPAKEMEKGNPKNSRARQKGTKAQGHQRTSKTPSKDR